MAMVDSVWKPTARRMKPELNPAKPPHRLIIRSAEPCTATRCSTGTDSLSRLEPPIRPKFHPNPRPHNDGNRSCSTSPDRAARADDAMMATAPIWIAVSRPRRSAMRPTKGLKAYMPAMWTDTTYWLTPSCPWSLRCTGVMAITPTIAPWETIMAARASRDRGWAPMTRSAVASLGRSARASGLIPPATTRGSGRSWMPMLTAAQANSAELISHGPV